MSDGGPLDGQPADAWLDRPLKIRPPRRVCCVG